ncbi:MAG: DUF1667 domain-containing protein [Christensenellaceae bacterium]|nr:DUF1667 domain-containing protein [Christensenellaceae bacterium]MEA5068066.1 DUF1667 domain-containing protein [Christensenellaceae bacterium]
MESVQMTCIRCPIGCRMTVSVPGDGIAVAGNECARGAQYACQEMVNPMRTVTSSVRVKGGLRPLCSVKTLDVVPRSAIGEVLGEIHALRIDAPIRAGQVLKEDIARTGVNLVATSSVAAGE